MTSRREKDNSLESSLISGQDLGDFIFFPVWIEVDGTADLIVRPISLHLNSELDLLRKRHICLATPGVAHTHRHIMSHMHYIHAEPVSRNPSSFARPLSSSTVQSS